jgi:hypothetical protein
MAKVYGLDDLDSISDMGNVFLFITAADRLWDPPSLLYNEYRGLFLLG